MHGDVISLSMSIVFIAYTGNGGKIELWMGTCDCCVIPVSINWKATFSIGNFHFSFSLLIFAACSFVRLKKLVCFCLDAMCFSAIQCYSFVNFRIWGAYLFIMARLTKIGLFVFFSGGIKENRSCLSAIWRQKRKHFCHFLLVNTSNCDDLYSDETGLISVQN